MVRILAMVGSMANPLVSAGVVVYNQRDIIEDTIDSVLGQTYEHLEIVVGDDGSTDGTQGILRELRTRYPDRIRLVLAEENRGITANCNAVLDACRGEYVAWLAGDDRWCADKVAAQVADLETHPSASMSFHAVEYATRSGERISVSNEGMERHPTIDALLPINRIVPSSLMHRRDAAPAGGFAADLRLVSDWMFMIELARAGGMLFTPGLLGRYVQHDQQVTKLSANREAYVADCLETLRRAETGHPELRRAARKGRMAVWMWACQQQRQAGEPARAQLASLGRAIRANPAPRDVLSELRGAAAGVLRPRRRR